MILSNNFIKEKFFHYQRSFYKEDLVIVEHHVYIIIYIYIYIYIYI